MRILFFGTPDLAATVLRSLAGSEYGKDIVGVVTREDKPKNRGHKLCPPPVKVEAEKYGYPVFQPQTLREDVFGETFRALAPDLCVVAAYGKILPHYILFDSKYHALNVHGSLLPKYRGAAPIQRAVMAGEKAVGITIMAMDDGLDTGDMLLKKWFFPKPTQNCGDVEARLATLGSEALLEVIRSIGTDKYPPKKQNGKRSTYASKITSADRAADFSLPVKTCVNLVRALAPDTLAVTELDGSPVKLVSARETSLAPSGAPGTVAYLNAKRDGAIGVNCADGVLEILRLIPEGRGEMTAGDFIRGRKITEKSVFEKAAPGGER